MYCKPPNTKGNHWNQCLLRQDSVRSQQILPPTFHRLSTDFPPCRWLTPGECPVVSVRYVSVCQKHTLAPGHQPLPTALDDWFCLSDQYRTRPGFTNPVRIYVRIYKSYQDLRQDLLSQAGFTVGFTFSGRIF